MAAGKCSGAAHFAGEQGASLLVAFGADEVIGERLDHGGEGHAAADDLEGGDAEAGGQCQRLVMARALLHDSAVYIFDEATSNIDAESENDIMEQIYQMKGKKTVLLISHRLANVTAADKIYVLEQGKIAEQGNHETLITQNGSYAKLWNTQQKLEDYRKEKAS